MGERYRLKRRLGYGGMAEVYLAEAFGEEGFSKHIAVKRVLPHLAQDERLVRMFLAEATLARHLHHQNVVEVLDVGRGPGGLFIAMELVDGWDLGAVEKTAIRQRRPLPAPLAAFIAVQVLSGLVHAYRRKVDGKTLLLAHRDVSPTNILVSREGEVKVADFGIAKLGGDEPLTEAGVVKGKLGYAAPEVLSGQPPTEAADQFSLGVTLSELMALRAPFGRGTALAAYVLAAGTQAAPPIEGLDPAFATLLERMLGNTPAKRFPSAEEALTSWATALSRCGTPATSRELAAYLGSLPLGPTPLELPPDTQLSDASVFGNGAAWAGDSLTAPEWQPTGPQMDERGRITGGSDPTLPDHGRVPTESLRPAAASDGPSGSGWTEAPTRVELAYDPLAGRLPPPVEAPRRKSGGGWVFAVVLLIGAGVAAFLLGPRFLHRAGLPLSVGGAHVLRLSSEPDGAEVRINGTPVGQTPLFLDNLYPPGDIKVELRLRGYTPWVGTFRGSEDAQISQQLQRSK
jgi:serine/threonine protein kinase